MIGIKNNYQQFIRPVSNTDVTTTTLTLPQIRPEDIDEAVLESFQTLFTIAVMEKKELEINQLFVIARSPLLYLFFSDVTQNNLDKTIFGTASLRDTIYTLLSHLRYNLKKRCIDQADMIDMLSDVGFDSDTAESIDPGAVSSEALSDAQNQFNKAYVTSKEFRTKVLTFYDWNIPLLLINLHYVDIITLWKTVNTEPVKKS